MGKHPKCQEGKRTSLSGSHMGSLLIKTERTVKENKNNCPNIEFAMHILMGEDWEEGLVKGRDVIVEGNDGRH